MVTIGQVQKQNQGKVVVEEKISSPTSLFKPTVFSKKRDKFDAKILLVGNSGSGKTHFGAEYFLGPQTWYMVDKGGEKTIEKLDSQKPRQIMVKNFSSSELSFSDFWTQFQQDEKDGLFDYLAENNGVLIPDGLTTLNAKAIKEICARSGVTPSGIGRKLDNTKGMSQPHWGQLLNWMTTFITALQELPCAVVLTAHLHVLMDKDQAVVARYPAVNGQFRQLIAVDFDEAYLLEVRGKKRMTYFAENNKFEAKTRLFDMEKKEDVTLQMIAEAYLAGKTTF